MLKCAFEFIFQNTSPSSPLGLVSAIVVRTFSIALSPPAPWCETQVSPHDGFMNSDYRIYMNNEHIWSLKVAPPVNFFTSASSYHTLWANSSQWDTSPEHKGEAFWWRILFTKASVLNWIACSKIFECEFVMFSLWSWHQSFCWPSSS